MQAIKVVGLSKNYEKFVAVDNITFNVEQGDFFGFIGPNGAGKTTTIKSMLGLLQPNQGKVQLLGEDITKNTFQQDLGYIPGEANLYDNLKVGEQIRYFAHYYKSIDQGYLKQLKQTFEINENKKIGELSLGNKKKVAIICSLMNKPKLLVFDEVSNSLDPLMQKALFDELIRLNKKGVTIFYSSHNLEEVQTYCKNVAIIRSGKIIKIDSVEKIVASVGVQVTIKTKDMLDELFLAQHKVQPTVLASGAITFVYKGNINALIHSIAKHHLSSIRIADVKLENIFEEYYRGDEQ
ncbi:ABC transporter ATP-binding protein [Candidatus Saccharibacteria bacterium]|nr:ABC transporter ATP-binding protein [Candidatus Saccharibacteria bacterium]